jgi:hypothetical protein
MLEKLPARLKENLAPNEKVHKYLKTFSIAQYPEYTFLTDRRIVFFRPKNIGTFRPC